MKWEPDYLFRHSALSGIIEGRKQQLCAEIDGYDANYILNVNANELCDYLEQKYSLDLPVIRRNETYVTLEEGDIDVSQDPLRFIDDRSKPFKVKGTIIKFIVPFGGDGELFCYQPSTSSTVISRGIISGNELQIRYARTDHNPEVLRDNFDRDIQLIQQNLNYVNSDVTAFNSQMRQTTLQRIDERRTKLIKDQGLATSLGFPLKRRDDAPRSYAVPVVRRKLSLQKPTATTEPYRLEPALGMQEYEDVLDIISNMVFVIERSPKSFATMKEEDLRQHFLVQLNAQYKGQATGETFNFEGKTDILIRSEGRNVFIAECKFWRGAESLHKALDQLLEYTTWRDTKTAIILFNRNKNLSAVLPQIPEIVQSHPNYKSRVEYPRDTSFRFTIHQRDDRQREILLTVMVFDVPA